MTPDLTGIRDRGDARGLIEACIASASEAPARHAFLSTSFDSARRAAADCDALRASGAPVPALAGLSVSVKDLFDVAGEVTAAGSVVLADRPPALVDSASVARLRNAGAALIGRTNMTEFAFSGVGINPHYGTPANPATARLDAVPRIPGGSSSGAAVSVATGAAWAALGSDTGGSIRIPAALQGLVGFKNTARLTSTDGAIPLSTTLDTACAITRSVRDAVLLHEVLAARRVALAGKPLSAMRFGVPRTVMLDDLEPPVARAFEQALSALRAAGAHLEDLTLPAIAEVPANLSPPEAWAWHRRLLATEEARYDPRVVQRIHRGEGLSAADYIDLLAARRAWATRMLAHLSGFDAFLSPTVPILPPAIAPLVDDDRAFFDINAKLLRNPSVVNMLDGCAISLPCQAVGALPVGLMLWHGALHDDSLLDAALAVERALRAAQAE